MACWLICQPVGPWIHLSVYAPISQCRSPCAPLGAGEIVMLCVCAACHDGRTVRVPWTLSPANCMPHRHLPGSSRPSACPSIYLPLCRFGHCSVRCQYGPTVWVQCVGWSVRACARPPVRSLVRPHAQHIALIVPQQLHTQPNAHLVFLNTTRRISTFILINRLDTHRAKCYSCTALMLTDATMDPEHRSYANTHQRQPPAQRANAPTNSPLARSPHHGDAPGCCPCALVCLMPSHTTLSRR